MFFKGVRLAELQLRFESESRPLASGIDGKDAEIVRAIGEEELSAFSFDGLRRITGTHPETLSRVLERLQEDGYVRKSSEGYLATERAREAAWPRTDEGWTRVQILHTLLPFGVSPEAVVASLRGRWFDTLRWVGMREDESSVTMKWVTENGSAIVDMKLSEGQLDVDAKVKSEAGLPEAVRSAHRLMGRVSKLYARRGQPGRQGPVRVGHFVPLAM